MSDEPGSAGGESRALDQSAGGKTPVEKARLLLEAGRVDEAVELYVLVAERHASEGAPFYAIAGFRRVLRLVPQHPTARERIGDLYLSMGFPDEASTELLTALEERHAAGDSDAVARITTKIDALGSPLPDPDRPS